MNQVIYALYNPKASDFSNLLPPLFHSLSPVSPSASSVLLPLWLPPGAPHESLPATPQYHHHHPTPCSPPSVPPEIRKGDPNPFPCLSFLFNCSRRLPTASVSANRQKLAGYCHGCHTRHQPLNPLPSSLF